MNGIDNSLQRYIDLGRNCCRNGATRETNLVKATEELGEIARHVFRDTADIDEVADLMLCCFAEASMIGATGYDLTHALHRKAAKGIAKKKELGE